MSNSVVVKHSAIGASSMHRWAVCPGSVRLSANLPSRSSRYAEEGTEAHDLAAKRIIFGSYPQGCDEEMREAVDVYVKLVESEIDSAQTEALIEHPFDLSSVHPGLYGTCDAIVFNSRERTLRVIDYKHGAGIPVDVKQNEQLMYYGLGALLSTGFTCDFVELIIVQPRCNHPDGAIRRWKFPSHELIEFAADLKDAALRTEQPNAPLVPGDHCRFCPAASSCPKVLNKAQELAKKEFEPIPVEDFKKLSELLNWLPILETWITSVRDFAYGEATQGKEIPGWKLVEKRVTRNWINEDDTSLFFQREFATSLNRELYTKPALKSVAQVEKVLGAKEFEKLKPFVVAKSSGNTLVPVTDKRQPIKILDAKTEFGTIDLLS